MEEKMAVLRDCDWLKNIDKNLKHEIEFIIKNIESLAENKIKSKIEQLLSKYKDENNIHELRKRKTIEPHKFFLVCQKDWT